MIKRFFHGSNYRATAIILSTNCFSSSSPSYKMERVSPQPSLYNSGFIKCPVPSSFLSIRQRPNDCSASDKSKYRNKGKNNFRVNENICSVSQFCTRLITRLSYIIIYSIMKFKFYKFYRYSIWCMKSNVFFFPCFNALQKFFTP